MLKVAYVTRSFLDYRIPVFAELSKLLNGQFYVVFSEDYIPRRVTEKAREVLGEKAIGLIGEKRIGPNEFADFANTAFRFVYQPGLLKQIDAVKPDVLICDGFFQWTFYGYAYKLWRKTPIVVCYERTFHTERNAQKIRTLYRKQLIKVTDAMACNGQESLAYTKWLGMPENRITLGHMVADVENLQKSAESISETKRCLLRERWHSAKLIFIAVGRLNERKGIKQLLEAWRLLQERHSPDAQLLIIGAGPMEDDLNRLVREQNISRVDFLGNVDYDKIAEYYAVSDVFVMPTLEDNWSLVVPEAMSCGLPVLCSRYNGCWPELVQSDVNGWVFDPLSVEDTYQALFKCIEAKDRLKSMGTRSRAIVSQFTPTQAAQALLDACRIAIAYHKGR